MKNAFLLLLPFVGMTLSCAAKPTMYAGTASQTVFHSFFQWRFDSTTGDYGKEIVDLLYHIDELSDPYAKPKEGVHSLYTINSTSDWVEVDPLLLEMLETALTLQEKTEGYFNPFIGELSEHWKETLFGLDIPLLDDPTWEDIQEAKKAVPEMLERMNGSRLEIDEDASKVRRVGEGQLDLGGLVKGFAVSKVKEMILDRGGVRYLVNGGQSSMAIGQTKDYQPFKVSLQYTAKNDKTTYLVEFKDTSTSAIYEQQVRVHNPNISGGRAEVYSHVINPITGLPQTTYSMAFLLGEDSPLLDAMSTSVMLAPIEKTREWASLYGFEYALFRDSVVGAAHLEEESAGLTKIRYTEE